VSFPNISEEDTDFFSTLVGGYLKFIDARESAEIASLGYPFMYQSRKVYLWKLSSTNRLFVRITFVDIALHKSMVRMIMFII